MKLDEKLREQLENAKTKDEMKAILKESDMALDDADLDMVVGAVWPPLKHADIV